MTNTEILQKKLNGLPKDKRERYAAMILAELEDEERWEELFAGTTEKAVAGDGRKSTRGCTRARNHAPRKHTEGR